MVKLSIPFLISTLLLATSAHAHGHHHHFGGAIISGNARTDFAKPNQKISQQQLDQNQGNDIGTLLEREAGVSNAAFGAGVGRPVMRGMHGSRVKVLNNGSDSSDVSAMSSDHAPMADLAHAHSVEILHGANTLQHGGGAIGGVVNVLDDHILTTPLAGTQGFVAGSYGSNASSYNARAQVLWGNEMIGVSASAHQRHSGNYQSGGRPARGKRVQNSDTDAKGASFGISWTPVDGSYVGASFADNTYDYGVPNEHNEPARVRPKSRRYQLIAHYQNPSSALLSWHLNASFHDYEHDEFTAPIVQALFLQKTLNLASHINHAPLWGWQGTLGFAYSHRDLKLCHDHSGCAGIANYQNRAWNGKEGMLLEFKNNILFAHDAPMPLTQTRDTGAYLIERLALGKSDFSLGARLDLRKISADYQVIKPEWRRDIGYYRDHQYSPATLVASAGYQLAAGQHIGISLTRAQRAPDAEELFWNGDHHATFSYQTDNIGLGLETAHSIDAHFEQMGSNYQLRAALFYYDFADFIFNQNQGVGDIYHGNDVYRYEQHDAVFSGAEFSYQYQINPQWQLAGHVDAVRARLKKGKNKNIPRTPPVRILAKLNWQKANWRAELASHYHFAQNNLAAYERKTKAFNLVSAYIGYAPNFNDVAVNIGLQINNLFDQYAQNHVSYLKEYAPNQGRNIALNLRADF